MDIETNRLIEKISEMLLHENIHIIKKFEERNNYDEFGKKIKEYIERTKLDVNIEVDVIVRKVYNFMFGYGILQELIDDDDVSDINVSRFNHVMVKRKGEYTNTLISFESEHKFLLYCKLIVVRNGGKLNENHCFDRVDDKNNLLRISASIPPRSVTGPSLSIRKHTKQSYTLDELVIEKMLDNKSASIIKKMINEEKNIIISGSGGAGKTTLLRSILNQIPQNRRFLVCESENELYPENNNFIVEKIISREHGRSIGLSELVRDGLSISLDGYCIGEIIGEEAWEFMKASITDHTTYATIHANGVEEVKSRLKMLINQKVMNYSESEIENIIRSSLNYIIYISNFSVMEIGTSYRDGIQIIYRRKDVGS